MYLSGHIPPCVHVKGSSMPSKVAICTDVSAGGVPTSRGTILRALRFVPDGRKKRADTRTPASCSSEGVENPPNRSFKAGFYMYSPPPACLGHLQQQRPPPTSPAQHTGLACSVLARLPTQHNLHLLFVLPSTMQCPEERVDHQREPTCPNATQTRPHYNFLSYYTDACTSTL